MTNRLNVVSTHTSPPYKRDKGHSIVKTTYLRGSNPAAPIRKRVRCECGKQYTGWGDRALYAHAEHARKATER